MDGVPGERGSVRSRGQHPGGCSKAGGELQSAAQWDDLWLFLGYGEVEGDLLSRPPFHGPEHSGSPGALAEAMKPVGNAQLSHTCASWHSICVAQEGRRIGIKVLSTQLSPPAEEDSGHSAFLL